MTKRFAQASLVLLLFLLPMVPTGDATHLTPRDVDPRFPDIPEEPFVETGIKPLRDLQIDAATAANRSLDPAREGLAEARQRAADEAWAKPLPGEVVLFTDRLEGDRIGGYGNWEEVGPNAWGLAAGANNTALTTGILAQGRYPANVRSLLATPELDLRTGFVDPLLAGEDSVGVGQAYAGARKGLPANDTDGVPFSAVPQALPPLPATGVGVGSSAIYRTLFQALDIVVNANGIACQGVPASGGSQACIPGPGSVVGGVDTDPRDGAYVLEFQRRFNLAALQDGEGRDGVRVVVFTEEPTLALAAACVEVGTRPAGPPGDGELPPLALNGASDPPCTVPRLLDRDTAPAPRPTAAFDGAAAFTGFDDWRTSAIDLTPWAERSVWVGFLFASGNTVGDPYFRNGAFFNLDEQRNAEFYGYQLDDLRLTAPGMAHSVRVRPIDDPWYKPTGQQHPTLAIGDALTIGADIANVGTRPVDLHNVTVRVFDRTNASPDREPLWEKGFGRVHLPTRGLHRVQETLPCDPDFCLTVAPAKYTIVVDARDSNSTGGAPEADPRDSIQELDVDVLTLRELDIAGTLQRSASSFASGDTASFTLPLRNGGNAPLDVQAVADLVDVATGAIIQGAQFAAATPPVRTITIPPNGPGPVGDTLVRWDLALPDPGQYRLFVRLDDPVPFDKDADLVPKSLQPQAIPLIVGTPPTIDGALGTGEWPTNAFRDVQLRDFYNIGVQAGRLAAASNGTHLFFALDVGTTAARPQVWKFFLDVGEDAPHQVILTQTTSGTGSNMRQVAEAAEPLSGLPVGADGVVRLLAAVERDPLGGNPFQVYHFPWAALEDGEGLQPPDGSQRDEMDSWLPLRLADPAGSQPQRLLSLGIGVDRSPPPMLEVDASSCDGLAGWTQSFVRNTPLSAFSNPEFTRGYDPDGVKWNCAPYGPDGRPRLYEGRTPEANCEGQPCGQWNRLTIGPPNNRHRLVNELVSPPIEVPAIADPYLILRHQYSTEAYINDEPAAAFTAVYEGEMHPFVRNGGVIAPQKARVHIQEWDEATQQWGAAVLLRPEGGVYTTQESLGISNPAVTRTVRDSHAGSNTYTDGWWWPTGEHPFYWPVGAPIVSGQVFSGSPWKVDRIPLFGVHGDQEPPATPVAPSGKTIRLLFSIPNAPGVPILGQENPYDFGWRIEGLAVAEGRQFSRDLAVAAVAPVTPLYDPVKLGLGPGTPLLVNVTLENRGTQAIEGLRLCVRAIDVGKPAPADPHPCSGGNVELETGQRLAAGATTVLNVTLTVPDDPSARLSFQAGAFPSTGDDFVADNVLTDAVAYQVRASPNLAVTVGTDQVVAAPGQARSLFVRIENRGNVPVTGFEVRRAVTLEDGSQGGTAILGPDTWTADAGQPHGVLAVGESRSLDAIATTPAVVPSTHLRMPGVSRAGAYLVSAQVRMSGDIDASDDNAVIVVRTQDILRDGDNQPLAKTFDDPLTASALPRTGTPGVWSLPVGGALVAGDPLTGEIPLSADAAVELTSTPIDLRSAQRATLSLRHRYDLEAIPGGAGFDAARVEISTDDGATWRTLRPDASPLQGLPDGYPSIPLTGDGVLAALAGDAPGVAFTGRSADVLGSEDGWIRSQFDLAQDPGLTRRTAVEAFSLGTFDARADQKAERSGDAPDEFFSTSWRVPGEANAEGRHRYWWVENLTYAPEPRSGSTMWWSGTAGPNNREESPSGGLVDPTDLVHNQLDYTFTVPPTPAALAAAGPGQRLMTWWEWRAGDADGGTGSRRSVFLVHDQAESLVSPLALGEEPSGWKRWGVPLDGFEGKQVTLRFDYDSAARSGFDDPVKANNRGWFLDDFQDVHYRFDVIRQQRHSPTNLTTPDTLEAIDRRDLEDGVAGPWATRKVDGSPPRADIVWSLVGQGAGARDGGWHVAPVEVPGEGEVPGWRFADGSRQGYPYATESRLVTPLVDLAQASGDLRLRFDHQYWFEAREMCPLDEHRASTPEARGAQGCFLSALDGGAVEYQVFDPATQSFGPWQALAQGFDDFPDRLHFDAKTDDCGAFDAQTVSGDNDPPAEFGGPCSSDLRAADRLTGLPGNRGRATYGGYPAIEERGAIREGRHIGAAMDEVVAYPAGQGTSLAGPQDALTQARFETPTKYLYPWVNSPVSYVFSGASHALHPGTHGWASEAWDVSPLAGRQVRFAFHAFSNPSLQSEDGRPADAADRGWSLANLRVEGDAFDGKPVRLRLRVATDSSAGAGEWRIDEAILTGERFHSNAAVLSDGPSQVTADRGSTIRFSGRFASLGNAPLEGIVATLSALRGSDLSPYTGPVAVELPSCAAGQPPGSCLGQAMADPDSVRPGAVAAFRIKPLDLGFQPSIPVNVTVVLPGSDETVLLRWALWKDGGDGAFTPYPLDVAGNAQAEWVARSLRQDALTFLPPVDGQSRLLVLTPGDALPGETVELAARIQNTGTTEPALDARWTVELVHGKGDPANQPKVVAEKKDTVKDAPFKPKDGQPVGRGEVLDLSTTFKPAVAGLYRATLAVQVGGQTVRETLEVPVGISSSYHATDFAAVDAAAAGWLDKSPLPGSRGGGSHEGIRFRSAEGRFLWGVTDQQYGAGQTYCSSPSTCTFAAARNDGQIAPPPPPPPVTGLEGIAVGPPVALGRVPQGQAFVTVRHDHNFQADDGARIEFIPLDGGGDPAFRWAACPGGAVAFTLPPLRLADHGGVLRSTPSMEMPGVPVFPSNPPRVDPPGETTPDQHNPLLNGSFAPQAAIGGAPVRGEILRYDLSMPATATCGGPRQPSTLNLVNYTVLPVLHVGTRPGHSAMHGPDIRAGAQGWGLHSIQVSSIAVDASPAAPTYPVQVGAPKTFFVTVTNLGQAEDRFAFALDPTQSTVRDPAWLSFPAPFTLAPGESRRLPVRVGVPADEQGQPGVYFAPIHVHSLSDPMTRDTVAARIDVRRILLPDLALTLASDLAPGQKFEAGTVYSVFATVFNVGGAASRPTELLLEAIDAGGQATPVERLTVPRLCPAGSPALPGDGCQDSKATLTFEWATPKEPGTYRLVGRIDPAGILDEDSKANNVAELGAQVTPPNLPDLAITDFRLVGATNGLAEEGDLVQVRATATNLGNAPAQAARLKIEVVGSHILKEQLYPVIGPGQSVTLEAGYPVTRGMFIVGATATHSIPDHDIDNDGRRLPLRVRGHELVLATGPANLTVLPGGTVEFRLDVTNQGNSVERASVQLDPSARGWAVRVLPNPLTVAPNHTASATVELMAPEDALAGPAFVRLLATPSGHAASVARLAVPVAVTARPEAPTLDAPAQELAPGSTALLVRLGSTSNAAQQLRLELESPPWAVGPLPVALAARANLTVELPLAVPGNATVGDHELMLVLRDAAGAEVVRHVAKATVAGRAAAAAAWSGAAQREGDDLGIRRATFTLRIDNAGNVPMTPRIALRGLGEGISEASVPDAPRLAPGESWRAPVAVFLAPTAASPFGLAEVWLNGDAAGAASQRAAVLTLPGLDEAPDLHVSAVQVTPRALAAGRPAQVHATIANRGGVEAPASTLFVSVNGYLVEPVAVPAIPAGGSQALNVTVTFTEAGTFLLSLLADGDGAVTELEDADNGRSLAVEVGKPAMADRLQTPATPLAWFALALLALVVLARRRGGSP